MKDRKANYSHSQQKGASTCVILAVGRREDAKGNLEWMQGREIYMTRGDLVVQLINGKYYKKSAAS